MKKVAVILLVVLYLIPAIGLSVNTHHCGGVLAAIHLVFLSDKHKCGCKGKTMNKNCCQDKIQQFKISDKHYASSVNEKKASIKTCLLTQINTEKVFNLYEVEKRILNNSNSPPIFPPGELFLTFCSLLI